MSIHILLHMLVLLHVNNFFSGIYVRLFKFREDFYSLVFNFAIFLQSRKTRNLNLLPRSQSVLRWTLGRGKSRYEISLLQKKERFIVFLFFQIISFTAIGQCPGRGGNSSRANRIAGVKILRESRYTGSWVEQRFIPEFLSSSKFQDFSSFLRWIRN